MNQPRLPSIPIAIVGMGCRFPQAADIESFWRRIAEGQSTFREIPKDRWNHEIFFSPSPAGHRYRVDRSGLVSGGLS